MWVQKQNLETILKNLSSENTQLENRPKKYLQKIVSLASIFYKEPTFLGL